MAGGGKETPRQRMVGMMYLVLTALLALQVQNEVLEKFYFIDDSLQEAKNIARSTTEKIIVAMDTQVKEGKTNPRDAVFVDIARKVQAETTNTITEIQKIRAQIIQEMGDKDPETGRYPKDKDYDDINRIMIGIEGGEKGKAYALQTLLNEYGAKIAKMDTSLNTAIKDQLPIAPDIKDDPRFQGPKYENQDWQLVYFGNTPMVASLAVLSQLENDVAKIETDAIKTLQAKLGAFDIKFDKVLAMASAESNTVAAGTKYKAQLFITATSSTITPKMTATAPGGVRVENGVGIVEFTASGGTVEGEKRSWKGAITIKNASGTDTTLTVDQDYIVVKPVIEVESGTVNSLYLKCGNDLNIKVPALGATYDPSFSVDGGQLLNGSGGKGSIIVVPTTANVTIKVSSGGNYIGDKKFKVKLVPKPEVEAKGLDEKKGGACPRQLNIIAKPDPSFADQLPKDARYKVTQVAVTLARGPRPVATVNGDGTININQLASQARPGDRLVIEVKQVMRMNFQGQTEVVGGMGEKIIQYAITQ